MTALRPHATPTSMGPRGPRPRRPPYPCSSGAGCLRNRRHAPPSRGPPIATCPTPWPHPRPTTRTTRRSVRTFIRLEGHVSGSRPVEVGQRRILRRKHRRGELTDHLPGFLRRPLETSFGSTEDEIRVVESGTTGTLRTSCKRPAEVHHPAALEDRLKISEGERRPPSIERDAFSVLLGTETRYG